MVRYRLDAVFCTRDALMLQCLDAWFVSSLNGVRPYEYDIKQKMGIMLSARRVSSKRQTEGVAYTRFKCRQC